MVNLGKYNTLAVSRRVDFGVYLDAGDDKEILLPARFVPDGLKAGEQIEVFVYNDSEGRIIATTDHPYVEVGQFAFLQVADVNKVGAFLDWGLPYKELMVPFMEQKVRMRKGGVYLVYVYIDHLTQRICATSKIDKYLDNTIPEYRHGDKVKILGFAHTDLGYKCIVDDLFTGMLYENELFKPLELEVETVGYIKQVREDGKIDLTLEPKATTRIPVLGDDIMAYLERCGGRMNVTDKSSPDEIKVLFHCSKKDFKKAVGALYKERMIALGDGFIEKA